MIVKTITERMQVVWKQAGMKGRVQIVMRDVDFLYIFTWLYYNDGFIREINTFTDELPVFLVGVVYFLILFWDPSKLSMAMAVPYHFDMISQVIIPVWKINILIFELVIYKK